jgi:hypothetical protein
MEVMLVYHCCTILYTSIWLIQLILILECLHTLDRVLTEPEIQEEQVQEEYCGPQAPSCSWHGISSGTVTATAEQRQRGHDATWHEETMRWLQGTDAQVAALQRRGGDGWLAQRWQFFRRRYAGAEQGKMAPTSGPVC